MNKQLINAFPGDKKGIIKILIKHSDLEESVQLSFDLDFNNQDVKNS
ncbi:hypothetical protein ACQCT3_11745 [Sutcliffiella horikoshii]